MLIAHFRRGSTIKIARLGTEQNSYEPQVLRLTSDELQRLHQAMIAWYADTQTPQGVCVECGKPTAEPEQMLCPDCLLVYAPEGSQETKEEIPF